MSTEATACPHCDHPIAAAPATAADTSVAAGVRRAAIVIGVLLVVGCLLGQFYPVFSDPITLNRCQPGSTCRDQASLSYAIGGAVLGILLGAVDFIIRLMKANPSK